MQLDEQSAQRILNFQQELKQEIMRQCISLNAIDTDGDLHDGFVTTYLEDGWITYKGFAWGFCVHYDPVSIDMTFGPDWPFVGYRTLLKGQEDGQLMIWIDQHNDQIKFTNAEQLANYGLQRLAAKAHDQSLFSKQTPVQSASTENYLGENV
jgi:hypothetical protein